MKRLLLLVALIWLPFLSIFAFAAQGDTSFLHISFHVLGIGLLVGAFLVLRGLAVDTMPRAQRLLTRVLTVSVLLALLGHLIELITALVRFAQDGFVNRDTADLWEEGAHLWATNLTIPAMLISQLVVLALVITAALQGRRRLEAVS